MKMVDATPTPLDTPTLQPGLVYGPGTRNIQETSVW